MVVLCFGQNVFSAFLTALTLLPMLVLAQKLAPDGVEATILSIIYTVHNLTQITLPELIGAFINHNFVGMTKKDMSKYIDLVYIQILSNVLCFFVVCLIPI